MSRGGLRPLSRRWETNNWDWLIITCLQPPWTSSDYVKQSLSEGFFCSEVVGTFIGINAPRSFLVVLDSLIMKKQHPTYQIKPQLPTYKSVQIGLRRGKVRKEVKVEAAFFRLAMEEGAEESWPSPSKKLRGGATSTLPQKAHASARQSRRNTRTRQPTPPDSQKLLPDSCD